LFPSSFAFRGSGAAWDLQQERFTSILAEAEWPWVRHSLSVSQPPQAFLWVQKLPQQQSTKATTWAFEKARARTRTVVFT
jgi:hypothetical protein